ncbi:MAG: recombinase family protein [Tissierellaceae bacterium]|nr:recombinase family protein [Tissierellaceae bacterium]
MSKIRVALYARVSTAEQAEDGYSIQAQEEQVKKYCEMYGKELIKVYADKGISGKSTKDRLALMELLEDCKRGVFDELVVWKTSRLARNVLDLSQIVDTLERNNIVFKSLSEPYDTGTPQGKLMMNMLASFAEFERTTIIENLRMGMNQRARLGYKNGGKLLGYKSEGKGKDSKLVIVEKQAEIVRMIFNMYSEGKGYKAITNYINKLGYKTVRGNSFAVNGVRDILNNPTYIGMIRFNKYVDYSTKKRKGLNEDYILVEGQHEAIVDKETWDKVRLLQEKRSGKYSTKGKGKFPLSGLLRCPVCGAGMVATNSVNTLKDGTRKTIRYYSCGNFKNKGSAVCTSNSVRADYAEEYVFNRIKEVLINEQVLRDIINKLNEDSNQRVRPLMEKIENIKKMIKETKDKKNKVFELYEESIIDKETLSQRIETLDKQVEEQMDELEKTDVELEYLNRDEVPYEVVKEAMTNFSELMDKAEPQQRKLFLKLVVDKITVENKKIKKIHIHFNETINSLIDMYLTDREEPSDDEGSSSSFIFKIAI